MLKYQWSSATHPDMQLLARRVRVSQEGIWINQRTTDTLRILINKIVRTDCALLAKATVVGCFEEHGR